MKTDKLHVILLALAVAGVCFGLYGMLLHDAAPQHQRGAANDGSPEAAQSSHKQATSSPVGENRPPAEAGQPGTTDWPGAAPVKAADAPSVATGMPDLRGDGVIEGLVLDAEGNPVAAARVGAIAQAPQLKHVAYTGRNEVIDDAARARMAEADRNTWRTTTDAAGKFRFAELAPGYQYTISVGHDLWGEQRRRDVAPGEKLIVQYDIVALTHGLALDVAGKPVPGLRLMLSQGFRYFSADGSSSGPAGAFVVRWRDDIQKFRLEAPGFIPSPEYGQEHRGGKDLRVTMRAAPRLSGLVETPTGAPVAKASVETIEARNAAGEALELEESGSATTDLAGRFVLDSLPQGEYSLQATIGEQTSAIVKVKLDSDTQVKLLLDIGGALVVRILNPQGKPIANTYIDVRDEGGMYLKCAEYETGNPGETSFTGLPRAVVQVRVQARQMAIQWHVVDLRQGAQRLDVVLKPGSVVTGKAMDGAGRGLAGLFLKLIPPGGGESGRWLITHTEDDGSFKTEPLSPGEWLVEVYLDIQGRRLATANLTITEGDLKQDVRLSGLCSVRVKITAEGGGARDWVRIFYSAGDDTEPTERHVGRDRNPPWTLPEGTYRFSASSGTLASKLMEVAIVSGRDNEVTLNLAQPNALRFRWIDPGSDLSRAGVKAADILLEYDGRPVHDRAELNRLIEANRDKATVPIVVLRGTTRVELNIPPAPFVIWLDPAVR